MALAEVLKRFKKAPTRLQIAVSHPEFPLVPSDTLHRLLAPFTESLTSLSLSGVPIAQIHALPTGLFPSLERLVINRVDYRTGTSFLEGPIVAFDNAPALLRVAVNKFFIEQGGGQAMALRLPVRQLTHFIELDHEEDAYQFLTEILPQCATLEWLGLELLEPDMGRGSGEVWEDQPVRIMENLRYLTLDFWGANWPNVQYPAFFDYYKFPGLRSLRLVGPEMDFDDDAAWHPNQVDQFISKIEHEFRLDYLSVCISSTPHTTLERLFKAAPHVTTLDAHIYDNYENFFEVLTIDQVSSQNCFLRLRNLVLELGLSAAMDGGEGETIDPEVFTVFLESRMRCAPCYRLRKIVLYGEYWEQISDETPFVQVIHRYIPEGLRVERRVVRELRDRKLNDHWMERDPELQDWLEASVISIC